MEPKVSLLIATYNRKKVFLEALDSMLESDYSNFEIIIADNASTDGLADDVEKLAKKHKNIRLVRLKQNLGINGGRSAAQALASGKYFLFMDSDVYVKKNLLKVSVEYFENHPDVGSIIPKTYFHEDRKRLWCAGTDINLLTSVPINIGTAEIDLGQYEKITEATHGPGAFLTRADVTKKVGGHDKKYFMCYADTDLTMKIKELGYKVIYYPPAVVYHDIKQSEVKKKLSHYGLDNPVRTYYYARNRFIFMKEHASLLNLLIFSFLISPVFLLYYSFHIIRLKGFILLPTYLKGYFDGWVYLLTGRWKNHA